MDRIINLTLKVISLLSKFFFILVAGRVINNTDFGHYALFSSAIVYASGFIGLEYHAYSNRRLLTASQRSKKTIYSNQAVFVFIAALFSMPFSFLASYLGFVSIELLSYFLILLLVEYLSLEVIRLLNILDMQVKSTVVYSIKTSFWMLPLSIVWYLSDEGDIYELYLLWISFSFLSLCVGLYFLRKEIKGNINIHKIRTNVLFGFISKSKFIFISSQCALLIFILDRYFLKYTAGVEVVSVYFFYFMLANSLFSILESSVFVFYIPRLIREVNKENRRRVKKCIAKMRNIALSFSVFVAAIMLFSIDPVLDFINKEEYSTFVDVFYIMLIYVIIRIYSLVFHYSVYAAGQDKALLYINLVSLCIFPVLFFTMVNQGVEAMFSLSFSLIGISVFHLLSKRFVLLKLLNKMEMKAC